MSEITQLTGDTLQKRLTRAKDHADVIVRFCDEAAAVNRRLELALEQIAKLYEDRPEASTVDLAQLMYDARCIARSALAKVAA